MRDKIFLTNGILESDKKGYFGEFGGRFAPEILLPALDALEREYQSIKRDPAFFQEFYGILKSFSGRPVPLSYAEGLTKYFNSGSIYIKREDLNHTGAHKINNVIGQGLLAKRLGKTRVIAETGAGQHGVATATMAAKMGLQAVIYMGAEDVKRQYSNVFWMKQLGAQVVSVESGTATLKDAINEAMRDWAFHFEDTHYCLGTACGPKPFPEMVAYFQSVISMESRKQIIEETGALPQAVYACIGGGSNAMGAFYHYLEDETVELVGIEGGGKGAGFGNHASRIKSGEGRLGVAQGYKTIFLQNSDGQMQDTWSISAGLDYIGISPILADLESKKIIRVESALDKEVIEAFQLVMKKEGMIPALESTHGFAGAFRDLEKGKFKKGDSIIINMSGRGDKDIFTIGEGLKDKEWMEFIKRKGKDYGTS